MNSVDMMQNLIHRAKNLQEFVVETAVPEDFQFNGVIPFDMQIKDSIITAKVMALDFNEAVTQLDNFLESCK
jgi:hypothetical protein